MESSTRTADAAVLTSALLLRLVVFGVAQAGVALVLWAVVVVAVTVRPTARRSRLAG